MPLSFSKWTVFQIFFLIAVGFPFQACNGHRLHPGSKRGLEEREEYNDSSEEAFEEGSYEGSESEEEDDEVDGLGTWRRFLKDNFERMNSDSGTTSAPKIPVTTSAPEVVRRSFMVAPPVAPLLPDMASIEEIRERLKGKTLEDMGLAQNVSSFKMAFAFSASSSSSSSSTKDLQKAVCLMDCQIASTSHSSGFRGKSSTVQEEELEKQWNNMTEIEKELIMAIASSAKVNETRRGMSISTSAGHFTTVFQVFNNWCTENCETTIKKSKHKKGKKKHRKSKSAGSVVTSTMEPPADYDYESDESEDGQGSPKSERRAEDLFPPGLPEQSDFGSDISEPTAIPYTVQVPLPYVLNQIFGEKTVSSLKGARLCLCGQNSTKICYCQSGKKSEPFVTMAPTFL